MNNVTPSGRIAEEEGKEDINSKLLRSSRDLKNSIKEISSILKAAKETQELSDRINLSALVEQKFKQAPEGRKAEFLKLMDTFLENAEHEPIITIPTTKAEMKAAGIETYHEFTARTGRKDGIACLIENWGMFLKDHAENKLDRDYISQNTIRTLDKPLLRRLEDQLTTEELNKILPSKSLLQRQMVHAMTKEQRGEVYQKHTMIQRALEAS